MRIEVERGHRLEAQTCIAASHFQRRRADGASGRFKDGASDGFVFDHDEQSQRGSATGASKRVDREDTLQQERPVQASASRAERFTLCVAVRTRSGEWSRGETLLLQSVHVSAASSAKRVLVSEKFAPRPSAEPRQVLDRRSSQLTSLWKSRPNRGGASPSRRGRPRVFTRFPSPGFPLPGP